MDGEAPGTLDITLYTAEAHLMTGHNTGSPERWWVLESIFLPFFWLTKVMVTKAARWRLCEECGRILLSVVLKMMYLSVSIRVRPVEGVMECSHERIAKKNPPMTKSDVWECKVFDEAWGGLENW